MLLSRNWNEETLRGCCNPAEVSTHQLLITKSLAFNGAHTEMIELTEPPPSATSSLAKTHPHPFPEWL